jgi:creatinine amidohydrolase/Fe(II)-dependent formamide hydrolase-like protein
MKTDSVFKPLFLVVSLLLIPGFAVASSPDEKEVKKWRWEEMFPSDMREALEEMPVAWVAFSPLEWHGEAMAFSADPVIGQYLLDKVWEQVGGVRIPTVYIGSETRFNYLDKGLRSHWGLETVNKEHNLGSLYTRTVTLQFVLEDYLYFLKREGFKIAFIYSGHGGTEHVKMMSDLCEKFSDDNFQAVFGLYGLMERKNIPEELQFSPSGHANVRELSLLGAIDPDLVDVEKFGITEQDRKTGLKNENKDNIDFEKGQKFLDFIVSGSIEKAQELVKDVKK